MIAAPHWRGHLLRFEARAAPRIDAAAGARLLVVFALLEIVVGPRWHLLTVLGAPQPLPVVRVGVQLAAALLLARLFARVTWPQLGLVRWREWGPTERSYFVQVVLIASVVFATVTHSRPSMALTAWQGLALVTTALAWGFYQELVYRGFLQRALTARFGAAAGILAANVLFTFGPLHFYHFQSHPRPLVMFAAIFAIGLYFGVLYHRSRNLWLPAVFHGVGTAWLLT